METSANFNSSKGILDRLLNGERVKCLECNKGYYLPSNPEAKINHWFTCDNCGDHYHWDPVVDIE